jgi:hypothetical protein
MLDQIIIQRPYEDGHECMKSNADKESNLYFSNFPIEEISIQEAFELEEFYNKLQYNKMQIFARRKPLLKMEPLFASEIHHILFNDNIISCQYGLLVNTFPRTHYLSHLKRFYFDNLYEAGYTERRFITKIALIIAKYPALIF